MVRKERKQCDDMLFISKESGDRGKGETKWWKQCKGFARNSKKRTGLNWWKLRGFADTKILYIETEIICVFLLLLKKGQHLSQGCPSVSVGSVLILNLMHSYSLSCDTSCVCYNIEKQREIIKN